MHDGQFIIYKGPDTDYYGKEIALTCNETALGIADVTDKSNLKIISKYESKILDIFTKAGYQKIIDIFIPMMN